MVPNSIVIRVQTVLVLLLARVFKGKGMPGHMGCVKVTVQNLEVVRVDAEKNLTFGEGCSTRSLRRLW